MERAFIFDIFLFKLFFLGSLLCWVLEVVSDGRGRVRAHGVARPPLAVADRLQDLIVGVTRRILERKSAFEFQLS